MEKVKMQKRQLGSIRSEKQPQSDEKNRSSGDFSIEGASQAIYLEWQISETANPQDISFKVMVDNSAALDDELFGGGYIKNEQATQAIDPNIDARKLYIANPQGATEGFLVTVNGFFN
jgi:hypothetical protein